MGKLLWMKDATLHDIVNIGKQQLAAVYGTQFSMQEPGSENFCWARFVRLSLCLLLFLEKLCVCVFSWWPIVQLLGIYS